MDTNDLNNLSILEVASRLSLEVKRSKALCFNHDERTPSLTFNDRKGLYHCFGCGIGGNVIKLVMDCLKLDFKDACEWLRAEFIVGYVSGKKKTFPKIVQLRILDKSEEEYLANPEIYEWIVQETTLSSQAKSYLTNQRGFKEETIKRLEIRDILAPKNLYEKALNKWGKEALLKCGLIRVDNNQLLKFIWWDHVIIFPFTDLNHRIIYLQARRMSTDGKLKYVNLKGIKKSIYNLSCIAEMKIGDRLVICEGVPDTITMLEYGYSAIGVLGAASFDSSYIKLLLDYDIYVLPDSDPAGAGFATKVINAFKKVSKPVRIINLPKDKKDLNEFYTTNI